MPVLDPGNSLGPVMPGKSLYECQKECMENEVCNSVKYCGKECTLYDKQVGEHTEKDYSLSKPCVTSYNTCPKRKHFEGSYP